ncbi:MAG TPA: hypothetical protein VHN82_09345 [Methanoregula sp.]|nr:hypothetical protein [Methanoregula sp.]
MEFEKVTKTSKISGRPRVASRAGTRTRSSPKAKTATCKASKTPARRETRVVVHLPVDPATRDTVIGETPISRTRSSPLVYEAMEMLRQYGYIPVRLTEPAIPINLIGMKQGSSLLVLALRSRLPVPSAARLRELFTDRVDFLRGMAGKVKDRIMIWVYSPACGWRYYIVYPGGLRFDLEIPKSIE